MENLAFAPDGQAFAVTSQEACFWNVATGKKQAFGKSPASIMCGALSRDGRTAILAENGSALHVFNATTGEHRTRLNGAKDRSFAVALSSDGRLAASGDGDEAILWEVEHGKELRRLKQKGELINALDFAPDGRRLALAYARMGEIWVHDLESDAAPVKMEGGGGFQGCLAFSPDGKMLAGSCDVPFSGGQRSSLRIWNPATGKIFHDMPGSVNSVTFSPDGRWLATGWLEKVAIYGKRAG